MFAGFASSWFLYFSIKTLVSSYKDFIINNNIFLGEYYDSI